jgi:hypothetical protein
LIDLREGENFSTYLKLIILTEFIFEILQH